MTKIIQVTTFFHPVGGGVEQQVLDLSKQLQKSGHDVEVVTSDATRTKERISKYTETVAGIAVTRCRTLLSFSPFYKIYPALLKHLLQKDFDIVHVHGFRKFEVYFALLAAKLKRKKIIVTTHNPFVTNPKSRGKLLQIFVKLHDLTFGKMFTRFIDNIIALTEDEIPYIESFHYDKKKIAVIPNGISDELYIPGNPTQFTDEYSIDTKKWNQLVLWVGRISTVKGLENLEVAVKQLAKTLFIFAGPDDDASEKIRDMYKNHKNVVFTGSVPHDKLSHAYAAADIFVLPSLHEAFGKVLIEAMAQGLPVISTNVGGPKGIVKKSFGILQNPTDQWAWLLNLEKLLPDTKQRARMGNAAKKAAQKYRWKYVLRDILKVYNS